MVISKEWNPKQAMLKNLLSHQDTFESAMRLCREMHALVHESSMLHANTETFEDAIWDSLSREAFETMPTVKDATIAWDIWHITRIEDLTVNFLIAQEEQVFNEDWRAAMCSAFSDTGNAMSDEEILSLSRSLDRTQLRNYRNAVGLKTRTVLQNLTVSDLKRKVNPLDLKRIHDAGGVTDQKESIWLLDFWGKKNIAGLLLMPVTRHQAVHLNDCARLKQKLSKK